MDVSTNIPLRVSTLHSSIVHIHVLPYGKWQYISSCIYGLYHDNRQRQNISHITDINLNSILT